MQSGTTDAVVASHVRSLEKLNRTDERRSAAEELGKIGAAARAALPGLIAATADVDATVRASAWTAISLIDSNWMRSEEARSMIPALLQKIEKSSIDVTRSALRALKQIGPASAPLVAMWLQEHPDSPSQVFALQLLESFGKDASSAAPAVLRGLNSKVMQVRLAAARAIAAVADPTNEIISALMSRLADEFGDVRAAAAESLAQFGEGARPAIRRLLILLADREEKARAAASLALQRIGAAVAPALVEVLDTRDERRASSWGEALFQAGHIQTEWVDARGARNLMWVASELNEARVNLELAHEAALYLLAKFGDRASLALPSIARALTDHTAPIRLAALTAIASIGAEAEFTIPELLPLLRDEPSQVRIAAAKALQSVSANWADTPATGAFLGALSGKPGERAIEALASAGKSAVPALTVLLRSDDRVLREQSAVVLGRLGAEASSAVPQLEEALRDPHAWVQAAARNALQMITAAGAAGQVQG